PKQIQTLSFLAYILRGCERELEQYSEDIPEFVIRLLQNCPPEASGTRKELLVATRHILSTAFRGSFLSKVDILLNEKVLIGTGVTSSETLRPLAYSMLADVVHHVRQELTPAQLARTVHIYSRNLHDPTLATTIQTMCTILLFNVIECIVNIPDKNEARDLLTRILDTLANKFETLNHTLVDMRKVQQRKKLNGTAKFPLDDFDFDAARPINTHPTTPTLLAPSGESLHETVNEEVDILIKLFREGIKSFEYSTMDINFPELFQQFDRIQLLEQSTRMPHFTRAKEAIEIFASLFISIDSAVFQEIISSQLEFFYDAMIQNPALLQIPQYFLAQADTVEHFAGLLLRFLVDRMEELGDSDPVRAHVMLRLFRAVFFAGNAYPEALERVLHPHLANIIITCMKLSATAKEPINYFILLKSLFRGIGGGKYEMLYKEVLPLLQMVLEGLNHNLSLTPSRKMRDLFVELCLTVPVRLSVLLPYLGYLMRPLVFALQSHQDLVTQGLRILELCIDNVTPSLLDPIMAPFMNDLMKALWTRLKPTQNKLHSITTTRILGKLGGRNRRMFKDPPQLANRNPPINGLETLIHFDPHAPSLTLPLDECLSLSASTLQDPNSSAFYREEAYKFVAATIPLLLNLDEGPENIGELITECVQKQLLAAEIEIAPVDNTNIETSNNDNKMDIDGHAESSRSQETSERSIPEGQRLALKRRVVQEETLRKVICALFTAAAIPELKDRAWPLLENLIRHFAMLEIGDAIDYRRARERRASQINLEQKTKSYNLESKVIVEALVDVMSSEDKRLQDLAASALKLMYETCLLIVGSREAIRSFPLFHVLASRFSSGCYRQESFRKRGGCHGVYILSSEVNIGTRWMLDHELEFVKSLIFILKDVSPDFATSNVEEANRALLKVLEVCHRPENTVDIDPEERKQKLQKLTITLIPELSNATAAVREGMQSALKKLAEMMNTDVTELLKPVKDHLLKSIFQKPLRALPLQMQIGILDCVTYCLTLRPPLLEFTEELNTLLNEVLHLADTEEQPLQGRAPPFKNVTSLNNLRIVCIKLLSAVMQCAELVLPPQPNTRARIIGVFFKSLYSKYPEIVEVANKGLQQVIQQQHKLPKELLQAGLRPILVNLSDHKKLTVAGLEGLARLLELLKNYFKVEIGKKLLDHLRLWAEPRTLQEAATKPLTESEPIKIIVAILNVFHLLPPAANVFLDELVTLVLDLEEQLRRSSSSPFREPLIKFLNRYSTEATDYFYDRLSNEKHSRLFLNLIGAPNAEKLREEIMVNQAKLKEKTLDSEVKDPDEAKLQLILIVRKIAEFHPEWLAEEQTKPIIEGLKSYWKSNERFEKGKLEISLRLPKIREARFLVEIFVIYLKQNSDDVDLLFDLTTAFCHESLIDYTFLKKFFHEVALTYDPTKKRDILDKFLDVIEDQFIPQITKTQAARMIANPILMVAFARGSLEYEHILAGPVIERLHRSIWGPRANDSQMEDTLRIELLQLSTLLVQNAPHLLENVRKDLFKFGWNQVKVDDITAKYSAYVLIARFIAAYETPLKFPKQAYQALLRASQLEARGLVRQALDIITPVLPLRIDHNDSLRSSSARRKFPTWAALTKKVLMEDGYSVSQLVNVYQLLVRHPDLFYDSREHFMPQIVGTLTRLGLLANATPETKLLTIDLSDLILKWERKRISEHRKHDLSASSTPIASIGSPEKRRLEFDSESPRKRQQLEIGGEIRSLSVDTNIEYTLSGNLRESVVSYLVRFVCLANEPTNSKSALSKRALELVKEFLQPEYWPEVNIKLDYFERTLMLPDIVNEAAYCNALEVLNVILERKTPDWIMTNIGQLHKLLEKSITSEKAKVQKSLYPVLVHVYKALPDVDESAAVDSEIEAFTTLVDKTVQDALNYSGSSVFTALMLVKAVGSKHLTNIDNFLPNLIQVVQKFAKEHIHSTAPQSKEVTHVEILTMALQIVNSRLPSLSLEQRANFVQVLCQLIDKIKDNVLARAIFEMAKQWIIKKTDALPTMKEKAKILMKMMSFESLEDKTLLEEYLDLVISIYSDPLFFRTDLTKKLEQAFLMGTRSNKPAIRNRFMEIFDNSMERNLYIRLNYIVSVQNWESLGAHFWLHQALDLLLGAAIAATKIRPPATGLQTKSITTIYSTLISAELSTAVSPKVTELFHNHLEFIHKLANMEAKDLIRPVTQLHHLDSQLACQLWVDLFPSCAGIISHKDKQDLTKNMIALLSKEYHIKQADMRPNCVQALLDGVSRCVPPMKLPPHLIKYIGRTFCAWHTALELLQQHTNAPHRDEDKFKDGTLDALADLYATLSEDDMYAGLWRQRSLHAETSAAVSYEQCGMWLEAQLAYGIAQSKGRSGGLPLTEPEYLLWEEHWLSCAERLQQWDILLDYAKNENNADLILECEWRLHNWMDEVKFIEHTIQQISHEPTPRGKVFESFLAFVNAQQEKNTDVFKKACDEMLQLTLRKWHSLPGIISQSHIPLLQIFQQYIELEDANKLLTTLNNLSSSNAEAKAFEMKSVFQSWRERLPNVWEDINIWSDLVAWRKHIFRMVNRAYEPYQQSTGNSTSNNNFAFRGHHETAWIINRFAHVARKHALSEVCVSFLQQIYSLPNIEIQEAFLKLREQTKCHYHNTNELPLALDVINNTNLNYFGHQQKAEFHTLKGMILAKMNKDQEANSSFATAVQVDFRLSKAWAAWGHHNDRKYQLEPNDISHATNALSCYLQAAGLYNNHKSRKLLLRILWLLATDDTQGTLAGVFESYVSKGDVPTWYWITFIPQLIVCLQHREARQARYILTKIAKQYPQALYFHLRACREEHANKSQNHAAQRSAQSTASTASTSVPNTPATPNPTTPSNSNDGIVIPAPSSTGQSSPNPMSPHTVNLNQASPVASQTPQTPHSVPGQTNIMSALKSTYPSLSLTLESMVEHIRVRLRSTSDEDIYRLIVALFNDGVQQITARVSKGVDETALSKATEENIKRFANSLPAGPFQKAFREEFIQSKPDLFQYVESLRKLRDRIETTLDSRPRKHHLEHFSNYLAELQHQKFDEIDMPGQYLLLRDHTNTDFIRIERVMPEVDSIRSHGWCYRRLTFRGYDGSLHPFAVQQPVTKHCRREEKIIQLFRILNSVLARKKESRRRELFFHVPLIVPLAPQLRIIEDDASYVSLQDVYEDYCDTHGIRKDEILFYYANRMRRNMPQNIQQGNIQLTNQALEVAEDIAAKFIPSDILSKYLSRCMKSHSDLWMLRKQFTKQMASITFMTYTMAVGQRHPPKFIISTNTGNIWMTDLTPNMANYVLAVSPLMATPESVPFRLTRNLQTFMTPIGVEGVFASSLMAIGQSLIDPEFDLSQYLSIFVRDEVAAWFFMNQKQCTEVQLKQKITTNVNVIVQRARELSCKDVREKPPKDPKVIVNHGILELIAKATNPQNLAGMDFTWMQWL
ncbi:1120_t:CDS:10, partial [Paraglomus occultum]